MIWQPAGHFLQKAASEPKGAASGRVSRFHTMAASIFNDRSIICESF
jgi:hypothetical protein